MNSRDKVLLNDDEQRALFDIRSKILLDELSAMNKARKEGREEQKIQTVKNSLLEGLNVDTIAKITGLDTKSIQDIMKSLK